MNKTKKSHAKIGPPLYVQTNHFDLTDPHVDIMKPTYNRLNNPHLRYFYNRKDKLNLLKKKTKEITEDNKGKCTFGDFKAHQRYLQHERLICERNRREEERARMMQFLEQQQEGQEMTLAHFREQMLDEYVERLRPVMEADRKGEMPQIRRYVLERWEGVADFDDDTVELDLQKCKADKRKQLRLIQSEVQHEWNRKERLREEQERTQRQKYAAEQRRTAIRNQQMNEQIKRSEKFALDEINKKRNPPRRSNIATKNPDARQAAEQRPMKTQVKAPATRRCR